MPFTARRNVEAQAYQAAVEARETNLPLLDFPSRLTKKCGKSDGVRVWEPIARLQKGNAEHVRVGARSRARTALDTTSHPASSPATHLAIQTFPVVHAPGSLDPAGSRLHPIIIVVPAARDDCTLPWWCAAQQRGESGE